MTLYSANIMELAKPVEKKKKASETEKPVKPDVSEKRMAALAKAQETRKRKREEAEEKKKQQEMEVEAEKKKADEVLEKATQLKQKRAEKRRLQRAVKKQEATPVSSDVASSEGSEGSSEAAVDEAVKKIVQEKKPVSVEDKGEPPEWFKKYVEGVKNEEMKIKKEKKPKKVMRQESKEAAKDLWADGLTRNRVQQEVDSHMTKMYSQIFGVRRLH
jgi:hypothetical protein